MKDEQFALITAPNEITDEFDSSDFRNKILDVVKEG